ncbi:MAG: TorD/DmsD family molecular chaperone [Planctomycetota bacterium]|jgi:nitrate reductase assembly molybdenum cofactor insertion protein NarJ
MTADTGPADFVVARARHAAYGLVSLGFQYPDRALVDTLNDPARWASWPEVLGEIYAEAAGKLAVVRAALPCPGAPSGGLQAARHSAKASAHDSSELQETFNRLFGHAVRGKCPPYELEYGRGEILQQASALADISGFYAAFGMEVSHDAADRPDHVSVECEFMSVLCAKQARAINAGEADHAEIFSETTWPAGYPASLTASARPIPTGSTAPLPGSPRSY